MGLLEGGYNNPFNPNERADKIKDFVEKRARLRREIKLKPGDNPGAAPDSQPKKAPQVEGKVTWLNESIQDSKNRNGALPESFNRFREGIVNGLKANPVLKTLNIQPASLQDVSHADQNGTVEAYQMQFSVTPEQRNMQNTPVLMGFLVERKTDFNGQVKVVLTDLNAVGGEKSTEYANFADAEKGAAGMMKGKIESMQKPGGSLDALNQTLKLQKDISNVQLKIADLDRQIVEGQRYLDLTKNENTRSKMQISLKALEHNRGGLQVMLDKLTGQLAVRRNGQGLSMPSSMPKKFRDGAVYLTPELKEMALAKQIENYKEDPKALETILANLDPVKTLSKVLGAQVGLFTLTPVSQAQNGIEAYRYSVRLPNGQPVSFTIGKEIEPSTMSPTYTLEVAKSYRGGKLTKAYYSNPVDLLDHLTLDAQAGYL